MNYYNEIKDKLIKNEIIQKVKDYSKNKSDLNTYYEVGKLLVNAGKHYGEGIIKQYSIKLTNELGKKYSTTSLKYMRQFYNYQKSQPLTDQLNYKLTWSHYQELLPLKDINKINYYIDICIQYNLSKRQLREKIKSKEYERLPKDTRNKLIKKEETKNKYNTTEISEYMLKELILEDISSFMEELGNGFCFVDSEYKIKIGDRYNYIDLLLFNYIYNCFIVIELKVTELKKENIGQIQVYMNYIDKNIKTIEQNKTIGIIICKKDNKYIIEYCSDTRIMSREYELV